MDLNYSQEINDKHANMLLDLFYNKCVKEIENGNSYNCESKFAPRICMKRLCDLLSLEIDKSYYIDSYNAIKKHFG